MRPRSMMMMRSQLFGFRENVGAQQDGARLAQRAHQRAHILHLVGIETNRGLVEDQDLWVVDDGLGKAHPLAHAFRQAADQAARPLGHAHQLQHLIHAFAPVPDAVNLGHEVEITTHRHIAVEGDCFRQVADVLPHFERLLDHVEPGERSAATGRRHIARQDAHGRRFPGAIRAEESQDFAGLGAEVDQISATETPVPFGQDPTLRSSSPPPETKARGMTMCSTLASLMSILAHVAPSFSERWANSTTLTTFGQNRRKAARRSMMAGQGLPVL